MPRIHHQRQRLAWRWVPQLEELEYRNLLATIGPGSVLPAGAAHAATPSITFSLPGSLVNTLSGFPGASLPIGAPGTLTSPLTGAQVAPTALNGLTPGQVVAQRLAITYTPPTPPPFNAGGEGMLYFVSPLQNQESNMNTEWIGSEMIVNGNAPQGRNASAPIFDWAAVINDLDY
jgi:hypothetical protein